MTEPSLSSQIEALVDQLRANRDQDLSMADLAAVTEVLIGSMRSFFRGIDTKIYRECREMSEYIMNARHEIAALQPHDPEAARIPRAGLELDAIVQQTEEATNTIMESAETIMNADPKEGEAYTALVQDHILRIFEACSFQDITGQRISKVVETLSYVEDKVHELHSLMGVSDSDWSPAPAAETSPDDSHLKRGPALAGEGIDQSLVDALIGGGFPDIPADAAPAPVADPSPAPAPKTETETDNGTDTAPSPEETAGTAEASDSAEASDTAEAPVTTAASTDETPGHGSDEVTQDDIDSFFS